MKKLYICRHGKSSWKFNDLSDFERPLNKRGERDAPKIGEVLNGKKVSPDIILSSPAKRAFTTAKTIVKKLGRSADEIERKEELYGASAGEIMSIIQELPEDADSVMIFGHNPGLTTLNNVLSDKRIDNLPTCGVAALKLNIDKWKEIDFGCGKEMFFEYPKKYFK
ncbi:MAG: histidine phosphatase family protein [Chlorobi bacterium]|nr:histidine phosphatase family protein [Chlorobiota bacterium]